MKPFQKLFLSIPLFALCACGPNGGGNLFSNYGSSEGGVSSSEELSSSSESSSESSSLSSVEDVDDSTLYERIWKAKTVHDEACVMIDDGTGVRSAGFVYTPTRILSVKNYLETKEYDPSEYELRDGRLYMTSSSTMPYLTQENISCADIPSGKGISYYQSEKVASGKILYTEGTGLISCQVHVTYEHEDEWTGTIPQKKGKLLPKLQEKLKNHGNINLVVNGDSIFTGCNASSKFGISPYTPDFPHGFANELERVYGVNVTLTNTSVGGKMADWGQENVVENIINYNPDLVLIGFGMNDGCSAWRRSADLYYDNIDFMVRAIQVNCPDCEVIVAATIKANPNSDQDYIQDRYLPYLQQIQDDYEGVALLDMTTFSADLLKKKTSFELYANNINHPCDFLVRQYVANLMHLVKEE